MWLKFEKKMLKIVRVMVRAVLKKKTPQEKREIKQKKNVPCLPHILEGSNYILSTKNRFSKNFTLVLPVNKILRIYF